MVAHLNTIRQSSDISQVAQLDSQDKPIESSIPVISCTALANGDVDARNALGDALKDIGFFALVDHDINKAQITAAYTQLKHLFDLPNAVKMQHAHPEIGGQVGFTAFGTERAKDNNAPDLKEFWHIIRPEGQRSHQELDKPPNEWPQSLHQFDGADFKAQLTQLYGQLDTLSKSVLQACSLYIGESANFLSDCVEDGESLFRLIHYPAVNHPVDPGSVRAAAHEDINFITLLLSATAPGLELLQKDGSWMPVIAPEDSIIVDSADMLENLTNGLFSATTHRVVNLDGNQAPRYSMPFFVHPKNQCSLDPLPRCVEQTGGEKKYRDIKAQAYLTERLKAIGILQDA